MFLPSSTYTPSPAQVSHGSTRALTSGAVDTTPQARATASTPLLPQLRRVQRVQATSTCELVQDISEADDTSQTSG